MSIREALQEQIKKIIPWNRRHLLTEKVLSAKERPIYLSKDTIPIIGDKNKSFLTGKIIESNEKPLVVIIVKEESGNQLNFCLSMIIEDDIESMGKRI